MAEALTDMEIRGLQDYIEWQASQWCRRMPTGQTHKQDAQQSCWVQIMLALPKWDRARVKAYTFFRKIINWELSQFWRRIGLRPWSRGSALRRPHLQMDAVSLRVGGLRRKGTKRVPLEALLVSPEVAYV